MFACRRRGPVLDLEYDARSQPEVKRRGAEEGSRSQRGSTDEMNRLSDDPRASEMSTWDFFPRRGGRQEAWAVVSCPPAIVERDEAKRRRGVEMQNLGKMNSLTCKVLSGLRRRMETISTTAFS